VVNCTIGMPLPLILGNEGAGRAVEVSEGVTEFAVGDTVISSFVDMCGKCAIALSAIRVCATQAPRRSSVLRNNSLNAG
jgi:S-(hydroxymethyl)glutathione dehydrogenase/alcohol dehydrogenase